MDVLVYEFFTRSGSVDYIRSSLISRGLAPARSELEVRNDSNSTKLPTMSIAHGIRTLGVLGAGQMGTGIALVSALRARVPVLLYDRSTEQVTKGLSLMDKLLAKDVAKGRLSIEEAKEARDKVSVVAPEVGIKGMREVDMVIEVRFYIPFIKTTSKMDFSNQAVSESLPLKQSIFASFAAELKPDAILATNTSSISITKIAASAILAGVNPASQEGKESAGRVVGK